MHINNTMAEQTKTSEKPDESNADSIKQIMTILNQLSIDVKQVKSDVIQVKSDVKRHDSEIDKLIKPNKLIDSTHKNIFASESTAKGFFLIIVLLQNQRQFHLSHFQQLLLPPFSHLFQILQHPLSNLLPLDQTKI